MVYCFKESCDGVTKVMETRGSVRRRKCLTCGYRFLTEEVEKKLKRGQRSPFTLKANEYKNA